MSNLFDMFSDAMPESMKKQEEELKKKEVAKKSTATSKNSKPKTPSIPESEKKIISLPVTVYYAREKLILECDPADMVVAEEQEEKLEETVEEMSLLSNESEEESEEELENEDGEELEDEDSEDDEESSESTTESATKEEPYELMEPIALGEYRNDIDLRIIVPSRMIEKGKISKEDARVLLQREFPELSKERTVIDYDKKERMVVPIVKAASKG